MTKPTPMPTPDRDGELAELRRLDAKATQGMLRGGHRCDGAIRATVDGERVSLGEYIPADDAALWSALVNAYRSGLLTPEPQPSLAAAREALEPFANAAELYASHEDDTHPAWTDFGEKELQFTVGQLRVAARAREALARLTPPPTPSAPGFVSAPREATELHELREEVAFWRRDLSARLLFDTAFRQAAIDRREWSKVSGIEGRLRPALAAYEAATSREWHDRCEACGEFVLPSEPRVGGEDASGHARCLCEDMQDHIVQEDTSDADLLARVAEAREALSQDWPEGAMAEFVAAAPSLAESGVREDGLSQAARDVLADRRRQVEVEGWSVEHDDRHDAGQLALAAAAYARHAGWDDDSRQVNSGFYPEDLWPFTSHWHPSDRRRDLIKAGALILAEIERLDRAATSPTPSAESGGPA